MAGFNSIGQNISSKVISSGGGEYKNAYSSISITIGEPLTETIANDSVTMNQGFQQGVINIVFVEEIAVENVSVNVFPNPTQKLININIDYTGREDFHYQLCDKTGRIIKESSIERNNKEEIDINTLSMGLYFIRICCKELGYSKTFKIIKT